MYINSTHQINLSFKLQKGLSSKTTKVLSSFGVKQKKKKKRTNSHNFFLLPLPPVLCCEYEVFLFMLNNVNICGKSSRQNRA